MLCRTTKPSGRPRRILVLELLGKAIALEITYDLTPDDLWQYQLYYRRHKAPVRPLLLYALAGIAVAIYLGSVYVTFDSWLKSQQPQWAIVLYLAAMPYFFVRFLPVTKGRAVKIMSKRPGFFCEHIASISPEWLAEKTTVNDTKIAWITLHSLEEDESYFYFFLSKTVAYIIPKRAFTTHSEAQAFLDVSRRYWGAAKAGTPVAGEDAATWPPAPRLGA